MLGNAQAHWTTFTKYHKVSRAQVVPMHPSLATDRVLSCALVIISGKVAYTAMAAIPD